MAHSVDDIMKIIDAAIEDGGLEPAEAKHFLENISDAIDDRVNEIDEDDDGDDDDNGEEEVTVANPGDPADEPQPTLSTAGEDVDNGGGPDSAS